MKPIKYFLMKNCPYCIAATGWLEELLNENPAYRELPIERIDESARAAYAAQFDYFYVPTFYVGDDKLHEGAASKEIVRKVLDAALEA